MAAFFGGSGASHILGDMTLLIDALGEGNESEIEEFFDDFEDENLNLNQAFRDGLDEQANIKEDVPYLAPSTSSLYNKYMGGVDVLDQQVEYYRTFIKTRKWTLKVLIHFTDLALVNAWRAYKIHCTSNNFPRKKIMDLLDFLLEISDILLATPQKRRGESLDEIEHVMPKKFKKALKPSVTLRHDGYDHLPHFDDLKVTQILPIGKL